MGTDECGGCKGLLKWKGVMFAPDDNDSDEKYDEESQRYLEEREEQIRLILPPGHEQDYEVYRCILIRLVLRS